MDVIHSRQSLACPAATNQITFQKRRAEGRRIGLVSVEMCAGAGGHALGLEQAGFDHEALVEIEPQFCGTLRLNRPRWNVYEEDLARFDGRPYKGADLLAGGLPCPPFSVAGK